MHWIKAELREQVESPKDSAFSEQKVFSRYGEGGRQGQRWSCDGGLSLEGIGLGAVARAKLKARVPKNT
jgi:hypothetical protein